MSDTIDDTYSMVSVAVFYAICKLLSVAVVWLGGYIAERDMSDRFTRQVFLQREQAPPLLHMVTILGWVYVGVMSMVVAVVLVAMYISSTTTIEMFIVTIWVTLDVALFLILERVLGGSITQSVSNKVYFNYNTEGHRAIRAVRHMLTNTMMFVSLLPFAALMTPRRSALLGNKLLTMPAFQKASSKLRSVRGKFGKKK